MLQREQLRFLYNSFPLVAVVFLLLAFLLVYIEWSITNHTLLLVWSLALVVVLLLRGIDYWHFNVYCSDDEFSPAGAFLRYRAGIICNGLVWGLLSAILFPAGSFPDQAFIAFVIVGISAGATTALVADRISTLGFTVTALLPLIVRFAAGQSIESWVMAVMVFLFLVFMLVAAEMLRHHLSDNITLRFASMQRAKDLQRRQQLTEMVVRIQVLLMHSDDPKSAFYDMLSDLLKLTESQYGFISEVTISESGQQTLHSHAISSSLRNQHGDQTEISSIVSDVLNSGTARIENACSIVLNESTSIGDKTELKNFLGLPVFSNQQLVAVVGLTNRDHGYDKTLVDFLDPVLFTLGQMIEVIRGRR